MYLKLFFYLPLIISVFFGVSWASDLSFSARLVNSDGSPVAGPVDLKFELAYSNDDSNILCTKELLDVELSSGVFHANLEFTSNDCLNNKELAEVLQETPPNESLMMRVVDETDSANPKTYPFQALNTVPMSVMSEVSQALSQMGATSGQVLRWNGTEWVPENDDGEPGTITSITAGDGLDGGTITETGTISVKTGGIVVGMLAPDSVTSAKIDDGTIENIDIKDGQITYAKLNLQDNDIQASKVSDLKGAAFVDVGMDSGMAMRPNDVPNCAADEKLQMSALPVYPRSWSCVGESTGMDDTKLPLAGGTMSGGIDMGGNEVTNLLAPSLATDATTKQYVDDGLSDKANTTDLDSYVARAGDNMTGALKLDAQNELRLADSDSNEYVGLRSHANVVGNYVLTLPADTGAADQVLSTDGTGNLSWTTPSTTATPEGSAGGELAGTYPNPTIDDNVIDNANIATGANIDAAKLGTGAVDNSEFNTLNGVSSSIQTQLDGKQGDLGIPSNSAQYLNGAGTWQTLDTSVVPENGNLYYDLTRAQGDLIGDAVADGVLNVAPSQNAVFDQLATKADTTDLDSYVLKAGDSMSGNLDMGATNTVTNLAAPGIASDAATKQYVDDGLATKAESTDLNDYVALTGDNMTGPLQLDAQNELRLSDTGSTNYVALRSSASVTTYTLTFPDSVGSADQVLTTDASGNLSWTTPSTTATPEGTAGGELAGTYPNPTIEDGVIDNANIATGANIDAAKLGTGLVDNTEFNTLDGVTSSIQAQLDAKEGTITAGVTGDYWRGDKTWQTLNTDAVVEATNQYFTGARARTAVVDDAIVDATTDRAPSQNAVFDALADKADSTDLGNYVLKAGDTMGGALNLPADGLLVGTDQIVTSGGNVGVGTSSPAVSLDLSGNTDALGLPVGSTLDQPASPLPGYLRFNTDKEGLEFYEGSSWVTVGGPPAGLISAFSMSTCPAGWLEANGSAVSRDTYSGLFSKVGTTFGSGDGSTTFNLPDLRGEFIRGVDNGRGVDAGRSFGSNQKGSLAVGDDGNGTNSINFDTSLVASGNYDSVSTTDYPSQVASSSVADNVDFYSTTASNQYFGVTRPRNVALLYCVSTQTQPATTVANTGSGTSGNIPVWTSTTELGDSPVAVSGSNIGLGTSSPDTIFTMANASPEFSFLDTSASDRGSIHFQDGNFEFWTNTTTAGEPSATGSQVLRVQKNGNVGVGTTTPSTTLHLNRTTTIGAIGSLDTSNAILRINEAAGTYLNFDGNTIAAEAQLLFGTKNNHKIDFFTNDTNRMVISSTGDVGIGTTSPSYKLDVNGTLRAYGITDSSDRRLKEQIRPLKNSLDKVTQLQGVEYFWRDRSIDSELQIGLIAQDIEKVFPELVKTDPSGMKSVNYSHLVAPLVESVKELRDEKDRDNQKQDRKIASLAEKVSKLEEVNQELQEENLRIKAQNAEIKNVVCTLKPKASFCLETAE